MRKLSFIILSLFFVSCSAPKETIKRVNVFKNPNIPPKHCQVWFDGCNKCSVVDQKILACTKMACFEQKPKKCLSFQTGPSKEEVAKKKCRQQNGAWQRKLNNKWVCLKYAEDHNTPCRSSQECQGICLYYPNKLTGFCSRHTPFVGCAHEYLNGKHFEVCE